MEGSAKTWLALLASAGALAAAGCGGEDERQDANEPSGTFAVDVVRAEFPERQRLARQSELEIEVRNAGQEEIPNLAVTVEGFSERIEQDGVADPDRPNWIIDEAPEGGTTAYVSTWTLGKVPPNATKTFTWKVTAVRPGTHEVRYRVAAGLDGKARAVADGGQAPEGSFDVRVSRAPADARVDPDTGEVVRGDDEQ
jgi:hypothetical protein